MENRTETDTTLRRVYGALWVIGFLMTGLAFFVGGVTWAAGAAAGTAVAFLNLVALAKSVVGLLERRGGGFGLLVVLKFLGLTAVTYGLITSGWVDPLGLAFGFGTLPLAVLVGGLFPSSPASSSPDPLRQKI
jgi:hypothetical protein